jgi:hypothetical protein
MVPPTAITTHLRGAVMSKIAALLAVLVFVVPTAASARLLQDYRSPDAMPAVSGVQSQDLRSPDARSPQATRSPAISQDLRSPDARPSRPFQPAVPTEPAGSSDSFQWGYLIGIAAALVLLAGWIVTQRRRRHGLAIGS